MDGCHEWIVLLDTEVVHQFVAHGGEYQCHGCHSLLTVDDHRSLLFGTSGSACQSSEEMAQGGSFPRVVPESYPLVGGPTVPPLENRNTVGIDTQKLPQGSTADSLAGGGTNGGLVRGFYLFSKGVLGLG
mmetsp:Transcript_17380/g.27291  ORF Transcript_17380/g.27291 Transcript_17380/m.27291 type:complete len:130 (+) Transcript_17380:871-1260(+)